MQPVVEMQQYKFRLLGIIDHFGCSANSGHYTSTLFRNDSSFHCNNQVITESAGVQGGFSSTDIYDVLCIEQLRCSSVGIFGPVVFMDKFGV